MLSYRLSRASKSIVILSAFTKLTALKWIISRAGTHNISIVTRWLPGDLTSGASDIECYEFCRDNGLKIGLSLGLHGKVYCTDGQILVGSANMTSRGLALSDQHNEEFGYGFEAGASDLSKLEYYLRSVVWLDDYLFSRIQTELSGIMALDKTMQSSWPKELITKMRKPVDVLWVNEVPFSHPERLMSGQNDPDDAIAHDLELLGSVEGQITKFEAVAAFMRSRAFDWLYQLIEANGSMSFGSITRHLHDSLLDDPAPYRTEVKQLVANLFAWAEVCSNTFSVSRPRHSQILALV